MTTEREDRLALAGPCVICGDTNYALSCGGPSICPKCDCGHFDAATVEKQARVIAGLRGELAALRLSPVMEDGTRNALAIAIQHIEHMAAWITKSNADYHPVPSCYSFESFGEDMPSIKAALSAPHSQSRGEEHDRELYRRRSAILARPTEATTGREEQPRCEICNWPLAENASRGCVPGDCSYRPDDPAEQQRIRERREELKARPSERDLMLEYARRLNTIAIKCEVNGMGRDASDLYRIAQKLGRQAASLSPQSESLPASRNGG